LPALGNLLGLSIADLFSRNAPEKKPATPNAPINLSLLVANLWALRSSHRLTQKQEADLFGVSERSVRNYGKGETYPSISFVDLVMSRYSVQPDALFYGDLYTQEKARRRKTGLRILIPVLAVLLLAGAGLGIGFGLKTNQTTTTSSQIIFVVPPTSSSETGGNGVPSSSNSVETSLSSK